jgi:hypothetical protein
MPKLQCKQRTATMCRGTRPLVLRRKLRKTRKTRFSPSENVRTEPYAIDAEAVGVLVVFQHVMLAISPRMELVLRELKVGQSPVFIAHLESSKSESMWWGSWWRYYSLSSSYRHSHRYPPLLREFQANRSRTDPVRRGLDCVDRGTPLGVAVKLMVSGGKKS